MSRVLIFGCGNPLRCDDGVGSRALDLLRQASLPDGVELIQTLHLLPEHASAASLADALIIIDASHQGVQGEIKVRPVAPDGMFPSPSHHLSPAAFLTLLRQVFGVEPPAYLVSLRGKLFDFGEQLSDLVESQMPLLTRRVEHLVESLAADMAENGEKVPISES